MTHAKTRALISVIAAACASTTLLAGTRHANAQDAATFYSGKTLEMIVGYPPGGSNDLYARLVANNIGRHVPGAPRVITQNMPGAGSLSRQTTFTMWRPRMARSLAPSHRASRCRGASAILKHVMPLRNSTGLAASLLPETSRWSGIHLKP